MRPHDENWENAKLTHEQALECLKDLNEEIDEVKLANAFNQADLDGDNQIDLKEVIEH